MSALVPIVAGCQSPRSKQIQAHSTLFAVLSPETQRIIHEGSFDHGFSMDLVYIALGKPNVVTTTQTDDARYGSIGLSCTVT